MKGDLEKESEIKWAKQGTNIKISFLGRDVLVFSSPNFITFIETSRPDRKEIIYHANCEMKGDGVRALCTHRLLHCFAFSELCRNPRILLLNYPNFEIFKIFESGTEMAFVALRFSELEFLVALTGIPEYKIIVWNWRTGEKVFCKETNLNFEGQILRMSLTSPVFMIQAAPQQKVVNIWGISFCYKSTVIKKKEIRLPETSCPPYCHTFGADGELYFVDGLGSLYSINPETTTITLHFLSTEEAYESFSPCATWYKGGVVFSTPSEIFFYRRKSPEGWTKIWSFKPVTPFRNILASALRDYLVGTTTLNEIFMFKGESQAELSPVKNFGSDFEFFSFINPLCESFVTYGNIVQQFTVWNKINGHKVSKLSWRKEGRVKDLRSNPIHPYLIVVTSMGSVHIINAYDPTSLTEIDEILLTDNSLNTIRFRHQGVQFCVANMDVGEFFLLKFSMKLEVVAHLRIDLKVVDYGIVEKDSSVFLLVVPMSQLCCRSGQTICLYILNEKEKRFDYLKEVALPTVVTQILPSSPSLGNIICVPHRSRKVYFFNVANGKLLSEIVSGHQTKIFSLFSNNRNLMTYGSDGLVIIKSLDTKKCLTLFSSHHRLVKGTQRVDIDQGMNYVIALGYSGCLVVTHLFKMGGHIRRAELEQLMEQSYQLLHSPYITDKLKGKIKKTELTEEATETTTVETSSTAKENMWLKIRATEKANLEEQQYRKKKQAVLEEFCSIKKKLVGLLDENEQNVPEKKLPVQAFDLDKAARRRKLEDGKVDREKEKQYQLAKMKCLNRISDIIKKVCWESIFVKAREIHGIVSPVVVQSYALLPVDQNTKNKMIWGEERLKIKKIFLKGDYFDPWIPRTESDLMLQINKKFEVGFADVTQTIKTKYEEQQAEEEKVKVDNEVDKLKYVWNGTSSHNFIEIESTHYSQFEISTYFQSHQEITFILEDVRKLMVWFNKQFEETFDLKERDVAALIEKNNRLRHIINELSFFNFSPYICNIQVFDPTWAPEEDPQTILTVTDGEVTVPRYLSESTLELMRKQAEEEERLRKLLLADDFKERALMNMMDGVLEKLWEDEIKKDVPKPKCMTEKSPEAYTEDDLKAIYAYEEAVKFLQNERERYRKILEAEWAKTTLIVKESAAKFDEKVMKLHVLKLKVESAIQQEILKGLRIREECHQKIVIDRRINSKIAELSKIEEEMESMNAELSKLLENVADCKSYYENLQAKDKNLEKNFKKEFAEYSPVITEQLYKLSKKRPKLQQRAATHPTLLNDLAKCVVTGAKPEYMPIECIQYLKDIDALDSPTNTPASVSSQAWETVCKLRRTKIDTELKIRACTLDLGEAEATVSTSQKSLKSAKDRYSQLQNEVQELKAKRLQDVLDKKIQLVLKKGLIEIPLSGQISDFEECVLVTKDTLNEVNGAIQKVGRQKIKAMQKATNFRKGIIYKEWEHKKLRMEIEDLRSLLDTVEKFHVLKELQAILVGRARGLGEEKGFLFLENALTRVKEKFEKDQIETHSKMDELNLKIAKMDFENRELDEKIVELNVEVNELNFSRDLDFDKKNNEENLRRMKKVRERSSLMRKIQEQHNEILLLQTELELLRLRTYPTIKQKIS